MNRWLFPFVIAVFSLSACSVYPRSQPLPFDANEGNINSPAAEVEPQMSDRYIVFTSDRRGRQNIYLFDLVERRLIDLPGLNSLDTAVSHPAISQNGRYIVFTSIRQGKSAIALYDRNTRVLRNLTANLQTAVRHPSISADGSTIAFESTINGQWDILVYDQFGRSLKP